VSSVWRCLLCAAAGQPSGPRRNSRSLICTDHAETLAASGRAWCSRGAHVVTTLAPGKYWCPACEKARNAQYADRRNTADYARAWREQNRERAQAYDDARRERRNANQRDRYARNPEAGRAKSRRHYWKNPAAKRAYAQRWREANREASRSYARAQRMRAKIAAWRGATSSPRVVRPNIVAVAADLGVTRQTVYTAIREKRLRLGAGNRILSYTPGKPGRPPGRGVYTRRKPDV
jgi:uncharacterized Zn finger protein (UPF0148 family)